MRLKRIKNKFFPPKPIDYEQERINILEENRRHLSNFTFDAEPLVSIIVLNRNGLEYLRILFDDFDLKTNYSNYEIILVDNASSDGSVEYARGLDLDITIIENTENQSFSKANNDAVKIARGEYILFLNNDIEPTYGWLNEMVGTILHNDNVGAVGAKLIFPHIKNSSKEKHSFSIQHYGGIFREHVCNQFDYAARHQYKFSKDIFDERFLNNKRCIIATAAVFLMKRETFLELDGFDESYWYGFEDVDLNLKLYESGYDVVVASAALLMHYESVTRKKEKRQNYVVLNEKWGDYLFKELMADKISRTYFLTDKKLTIQFIIKKSFKNRKLSGKISKAAGYLKSQGYDVIISKDPKIISRKVDAAVFAEEMEISNGDERDNLIRVLISQENNEKYDITIKEDDLGEGLISALSEYVQ